LYGLCHAAILSGGYSPAIGFIHTGKQLSFVYDVADLYKAQYVIPLAFRVVATGTDDIESRVRRSCRDIFRTENLVQRILPDIASVLDISPPQESEGLTDEIADDDSKPAEWWQPATLPPEMPIGLILEQAIQRPWKGL